MSVAQWGRNLPFPANHPIVMKNQTKTDLTQNNNSDIVLPAGSLAVSSGDHPNPSYGIVRFTSPSDGLYSIRAIFSGIQFSGGGTTTDIHVLINGSSVFDSEINSFGQSQNYASSALVYLADGATVDFVVGPGSNRNQSSDWTGLTAVITDSGLREFSKTFTVTRTNSTGPGSLPVIISQANATPGNNVIEFAVSGMITLDSPFPTITNNLTINGRLDNAVAISGGGMVPIFRFATGTTNFLNRLTLADGNMDDKGLKGEYFGNMDLSGNPVLTRIDNEVNFDWGNGSPAPSIPTDHFSVRWSGQVQPRYSETYAFVATTDDGVRLWVNGRLIIDEWRDKTASPWSGSINLIAEKRYDIRMEYYENGGSASAKLSWRSDSQPTEIIPTKRLYLAGGFAGGGGAINNSGLLFISNCTLTNNRALKGGAISNAGSVTIVTSKISSNVAMMGGAIYNLGNLVLTDCQLTQNNAENGGAVNNMGTLRLDSVMISRNEATLGFGGGIFNSGSLNISASTISSNVATGGEGGRLGGGGGAGFGGGVFNADGKATLINCTFSGNRAIGGRGGGDSSVEISYDGGGNNPGRTNWIGGNAGFGGGGAGLVGPGGGDGGFGGGGGGGLGRSSPGNGGAGGGIGHAGYELKMDKGDGSFYYVLYAGGGGGGAGMGGGLFVKDGTVSFVNCTVANNAAEGGDGGIRTPAQYNGASGQGIGGGIYNLSGLINLVNTVAANNLSKDFNPDLSGAFASVGFNLIGNDQGTAGLSIADFRNVPANLGPLQDNGGPTLTHALLQGSPAIGNGTTTGAPTTDQRGIPRQSGRVDIGAFQLLTLITPTITWPKPADIIYGTPLGTAQLNAIVGVDGTLTYRPPVGTILPAGPNQVLTVVFTPKDLALYLGATNLATINVLESNQTITFPTIPNQRIGGAPILLTANASSGLPVTFSIVSGPATLTGNLLVLSSTAGAVTVRASQAGNSNFNAAPNVDRTFVLGTLPPPLIMTQPSSQTVNPGDRVTFTVVATNGPLSYQWRFAGIHLPGETGSSLVLGRVKTTQAGAYDVIVSNPSGSVNSLAATLKVNVSAGTPIIITQPQRQNVRASESAILSVMANGTGPLIYQWYQGQSGDVARPILSATNANFTVSNLSTDTSYWVSVRNLFGTVDSDTALVRVFPATAAKLGLRFISGLPAITIDGIVGTNYRVEYTTDFGATNWTLLLSLSLPSTPFTLVLPPPDRSPLRFYRTVVP